MGNITYMRNHVRSVVETMVYYLIGDRGVSAEIKVPVKN